MKTKLLLLGIISLMFFACGGGDSYTLKGSFTGGNSGKFNGKQAVLATSNGDKLVRVDSVVIADDAFTLKGDGKSIDMGFILCEGIEAPMPFVTEKGNINMEIGDKGSKVTGTTANMAFQNLLIGLNNKQISYDKIMASLKKLKASTLLTPEKFASVEQNLNSNKQESEVAVVQFINGNIDNPLAEYIFINYNDKLSPAKAKEVLGTLKNVRNTAQIEKITKIVDAKISTSVGQKYVNITGENIKGKETQLSDFIGKNKQLVLVDFWASWCGPCREFVPALQQISKDNKGLTIVGVTLDEDKDAWIKATKDLGITWEQIKPTNTKEVQAAYGINLIPYVVVVDDQGIIKIAGHFEDVVLEYKIKALQGEAKK